MRIRTKKIIVTIGIIVGVGVSAITTKAYTTCSFSASNNEVTAYANGNINTSAFSYGGYRTNNNVTKYVPARMWVNRAFYSTCYESGRALTVSSFTKTRNATSKDEKGIRIELRTYDTDGVKKISYNSRVIKCK